MVTLVHLLTIKKLGHFINTFCNNNDCVTCIYSGYYENIEKSKINACSVARPECFVKAQLIQCQLNFLANGLLMSNINQSVSNCQLMLSNV